MLVLFAMATDGVANCSKSFSGTVLELDFYMANIDKWTDTNT